MATVTAMGTGTGTITARPDIPDRGTIHHPDRADTMVMIPQGPMRDPATVPDGTRVAITEISQAGPAATPGDRM